MSTNAAAVTFKRKKLLTRPVLKLVENQPIYVKFESAIYLGKEMKADKVKEGEKKRDPAHLADVIDLVSGEQAQIIASAVVMSVLDENYPDTGYVGKCFSITKKGRAPGKQYFGYNVEEIDDPNAEVTTASAVGETSGGGSASAHSGKKKVTHVDG